MPSPIRVLTAVPICDGHDSAINTINLEFIQHGIEVVYLGFHRYAKDIVRAAVQEDVDAVGLSILSGAHNRLLPEIVKLLRDAGAHDVLVFAGGIIPDRDIAPLKQAGVDQIFLPGTSTGEIVKYLETRLPETH